MSKSIYVTAEHLTRLYHMPVLYFSKDFSTFVLCSVSQIYGGDFAKFCGLLRIYELYISQIFELST